MRNLDKCVLFKKRMPNLEMCYKFFCSCGMTYVSKMEMNSCKKCGRSAELIFDKWLPGELGNKFNKVISKKEIMEILEDEYSIYLPIVTTNYQVQDASDPNLIQVQSNQHFHLFFFDKRTNEVKFKIFASDGRTFVFSLLEDLMFYSKEARRHSVLNAITDAVSFDNLEKFIERIFKLQNILYTDASKFAKPENFFDAIVLAKCPSFELLPYHSFFVIPNGVFEKVASITRGEDMWKTLTGHTSKTIKEKGKTISGFNELITWGCFIKSSSNLINFLNGLSKRGDKFVFENCPDDWNEFESGMRLILDLHKDLDEKVWLKRLIKLTNQFIYLRSSSGLSKYIADIGRSYRQIVQVNKEYKAAFNGSIADLHDHLAKDFSKCRFENVTIPYTDDEYSLEQKINQYEFELVVDTNALMNVGSLLYICVGTYRERVLKKSSTIFSIKKEDKLIACLELNPNKEVIETKMKYNHSPSLELSLMIKQWAETHDINWKVCYDLCKIA
jgi:hypothetical protein